jgi:hypothetical protein
VLGSRRELEAVEVGEQDAQVFRLATGVRQKPVKPAWQFLQKPQATLNGITTRSPACNVATPGPASSMTPRFS